MVKVKVEVEVVGCWLRLWLRLMVKVKVVVVSLLVEVKVDVGCNCWLRSALRQVQQSRVLLHPEKNWLLVKVCFKTSTAVAGITPPGKTGVLFHPEKLAGEKLASNHGLLKRGTL